MENRRRNKPARKNKGLLINFARTIGATLGSVAAKTDLLSKPAPRPATRPASRRRARGKSGSVTTKARKKNKS
jgi:hypothetical protein